MINQYMSKIISVGQKCFGEIKQGLKKESVWGEGVGLG